MGWNNYAYNKEYIKIILMSLTRMEHLPRKQRPCVEHPVIKSCKDKKSGNNYLSPFMVLKVTGYTSCNKNLQNSSMMPAKLQWYFEAEYSENKNKAIDILPRTVLRWPFLENWKWTKIKSDNENSHAESFKVGALCEREWNVPSGKILLNVLLPTMQVAT